LNIWTLSKIYELLGSINKLVPTIVCKDPLPSSIPLTYILIEPELHDINTCDHWLDGNFVFPLSVLAPLKTILLLLKLTIRVFVLIRFVEIDAEFGYTQNDILPFVLSN